jgi:hypothetical protein
MDFGSNPRRGDRVRQRDAVHIRSLIVLSVRPAGVKPKPPSAVASRGLTPPTRPKVTRDRIQGRMGVFPKSGGTRRGGGAPGVWGDRLERDVDLSVYAELVAAA